MRLRTAVALLVLLTLPAGAAARRRAVTPGGRCAAGGKLAGESSVLGIAVDATHVYYHDESTNQLWRVSKAGGPPVPLMDLMGDSFAALTVDAARMYVAAIGVPAADAVTVPPARIFAVPKSGGSRTLIAANVLLPHALAADETHLYWSSSGTLDVVNDTVAADGKIERVALDGTGRETLATALSAPAGLVLDGGDAWFAESGTVSSGLRRVSKSGGPVTHVVDGPAAVELAVDGDQIAFIAIDPATREATGVHRISKNGGAITTLFAGTTVVSGLRVQDGNAYFLTSDDTMSFVPLSGGTRGVIARAPFGWFDFEIDPCSAYFATLDDELLAANTSARALDAPRITSSSGLEEAEPRARAGHSMVYDTRLRTVLLLNGDHDTTSTTGDVWTWSRTRRPPLGVHLSRYQTRWHPVDAAAPPSRTLAAVAWDSRRGVLVMQGGLGSGDTLYGDTQEWDGTQWRQVSTAGPGIRNHHAMVYDAARGVVVLFGGQDRDINLQRDTWEWDGTSWSRVATSGPPARVHHALVYDAARQRVLLYGGVGSQGDFSDFWEWDGAAWRLIAAQGPGPRVAHRMAFHAGIGKVVLVGGFESDDRMWMWDGSTWSRSAGATPSARGYHAMAYDEARRRMVLFGGYRNSGNLSDTWEMIGEQWVRVDPGD